MNNWQHQKLGNVADVKLSNVDKVPKENERIIRLCNYTDVYKNSFINADKSNSFMIASCNEVEYKRFILRKGQVAITKDSETPNDIGVSTYISEDFHDVVLGYHLALITPNEDKLNGRFLHYWLNTKQSKQYFENNAGGSGQRCTLTLDCIKSIPLYLPNIQIQESIAKILSDLDIKIELNNRINQELEEMAKTLYDYWFVQFDFPSERGKPYKSSGGKMVYRKELKREIPEGWNIGSFNDLGEVVGGSTPSRSNTDFYSNNGIAWITPNDLSNNKGNKFISHGEFDITEAGFKNASLRILPKDSILLSSRAPIGYMAICQNDVTTNQGFKSFIPNKGYHCSFVYYAVKNSIKLIEKNASGSTFKEISGGVLKSLPTILPSKKLIGEYAIRTKSIFERQSLIESENQKLKELRDWLLPMLMNGQITVCEVEEELRIAAEPREEYGN